MTAVGKSLNYLAQQLIVFAKKNLSMDQNIDWDLLAKYIFGECSEEEEAEVQTWIAEDTARKALVDELRQVWETTDRPPAQWDMDALWGRINEHIEQEKKIKPLQAISGRSSASQRTRSSHSAARHLLRVAATIAVVALAALLAVQLQNDPGQETSALAEKVFATKRGERATLQLTDGTHIRLNVDSKLRLSSTFSSDVREVWLQGEAYFDVAEDSARPFIVHAGPAAVRVLGTEFGVNAYPGEERVQVVVAEGKVSFHPEQTSSREGMVLTERQMGRLSRGGEQVVRREVNPSRYLAWMEGQLVFEDAPFEEVARKLERWYDLSVVLADSPAASGHLNASFTEQQSLHGVLNVIATAFGLNYEREGKAVTFYPAKPSFP